MVAKSINTDGERKCWVIKTTEGGLRKKDHWDDFKMDNVVAVGWSWIKADPAKFSNYRDFFKHLYSKKYAYEGSLSHIASTIYKFAHDWQYDDLIVICEGYSANQLKKVRLHGFAFAGDYFFDPKPEWRWRYKRNAEIKSIERDIPKSLFVKSFGMGSLLKTTHGPFPEKQFSEFSQQVQKLHSDLEL
jgi:predicted Mrr-cat superfamily restriction endonuclease